MENKLELMVKESGLEASKANLMLEKFKDYFKLAAEWEIKAKGIVVTDGTQLTDMKMAKIGRLFLREKRISIEKARKELKEQALREGKAIDGIANVLKALIIPIEEYLEKQEKFAEIKEKERIEVKRIEAEKKEEEERIAKEKAEEEERERIRIENEKLKKEADEREQVLKDERVAAAKKQVEQAAKLEKQKKEAKKKQEAIEEKARKEKERFKKESDKKLEAAKKETERVEAELKAKEEAEAKIKEEEQQKIEDQKKASDKDKLINLSDIIRPMLLEVKSKKAKKVVGEIYSILTEYLSKKEV